MAVVTEEDYDDLIAWVKIIARDAATAVLARKTHASATMDVEWVAMKISDATAKGFEQLLVNEYGEG